MKSSCSCNQRCRQALIAVQVIMAEKTTDTEVAVVDRGTVFRGNPQNLALLAVHIHLALCRAEGADRRGLAQLPGTGLELERLGDHGAGRADLHAVAAELTLVEILVDKRLVALFIDEQGAGANCFMTGLDAFLAHDAAVGNLLDQRPVVDGCGVDVVGPEWLANNILRVADILQVAFATGIADRAIKGMIDQQQLDDLAAGSC